MSINFIPRKGATIPPNPYMKRLRRSRADAPIGFYVTPRSASGISNGIIIALKITADRIALSGE